MALSWVLISLYFLMLLTAGYFLPSIRNQHRARLIAWMIAIVTVFFCALVCTEQEAFTRMLVIVVLQLVSMKILVVVETYTLHGSRLTAIQWAAFCLGWFGMRPVLFEKLPQPSLGFAPVLWKGLSRIIIGSAFLYLSLILEDFRTLKSLFIPQLSLLIGLSLFLHFGILNVATAMWRGLGVNVSELFQAPYQSKSLKEFWGKRWNIAFSEMTALIAYRPLKNKIGIEKALIASFLISGVLHEIAISLPVRSGFGLPMIYFIIQATAMHLEGHSITIKRITLHRWLSHVWVMSLLILPIPLLFHHEFIQQVLLPLRTLILTFGGVF